MKLKDLSQGTNVLLYKLKIPQDGSVTMLTGNLTEGYIVGMFAQPGGWFMSADPPNSPKRTLIPTYGENEDILEWEIIEEPKLVENGED